MGKRNPWTPAILLPALVIGPACEQNPDHRERRADFFAQEHISLGEALAIAQNEVPGAEPVLAVLEVEPEEDEIAYEVVLQDGMQMVEVEVDPVTGDVLEIEYGEDDDDEDDDD